MAAREPSALARAASGVTEHTAVVAVGPHTCEDVLGALAALGMSVVPSQQEGAFKHFMQRCPECEGDGTVGDADVGPAPTCPICRGHGYVPIQHRCGMGHPVSLTELSETDARLDCGCPDNRNARRMRYRTEVRRVPPASWVAGAEGQA